VRWALAVTFPLLYFWMLTTQGIVYGRYLLPIIPPLCVLAAVAVVSGVSLLRRYEIPRAPRTALIAALTIAALLPPAIMSVRGDRDIARQSTVDLAYAWIVQNVPADAKIIVEGRVVMLPSQYRVEPVTALRFRSYEQWRSQGADYLIASSGAYGAVFNAPQNFPNQYEQYMRIFTQSRELARFTPSAALTGPELRIFKVVP
jgi:hypothetical protein